MMKLLYKDNEIFYTITGIGHAKIPFVLLHGFLEDMTIWDGFIDGLGKERQIVCIDLPGHGRSKDFSESHSMQEMANIVAAVLKDTGIQQVSLAGHSMGGYVGLEFLDNFPMMLKDIMLINSTPAEDTVERKKIRDRSIDIVEANKDAFVSMAISNLFSAESREVFKAEIDRLKQAAFRLNIENIQQTLKAMRDRKDHTASLKKFRGGKMIVAGEDDTLIEIADIQKLARTTNSDLIILEKGHNSWMEMSEKLYKNMYLID
ncbi:alpha/beta fold hydrolase [Christiangramia sp. LLG6405-1]|uniref:alpha/beta fold hydrolase n=1 Tax=Christiangramia sp. LLG6405-1 TaxID=3160832 RepID=UPI00386DA9D2